MPPLCDVPMPAVSRNSSRRSSSQTLISRRVLRRVAGGFGDVFEGIAPRLRNGRILLRKSWGGGLGRARKPRAPAREAHGTTPEATTALGRVGLRRQRHLETEPFQALDQIAPQPLRFQAVEVLHS